MQRTVWQSSNALHCRGRIVEYISIVLTQDLRLFVFLGLSRLPIGDSYHDCTKQYQTDDMHRDV